MIQLLDYNAGGRSTAKKFKIIPFFSFTYCTKSYINLKLLYTKIFFFFFKCAILNLLLELLKNTTTEETNLPLSDIRFTKQM